MSAPVPIHPSLLPYTQTGSRTKTMMFGLDPDPRSLGFIRERGILESEAERERGLRTAKGWLDACYRASVEGGLSKAPDEVDLALVDAVCDAADALAAAKGAPRSERLGLARELEGAELALKEAVAALFAGDPLAECSKAGELVSKVAPERMRELGMLEEADAFAELSYRASYYADYLLQRRRIFTASRDAGHGTVADRVVEDNLPIMRRNLVLAGQALEAYPEAARAIGLEASEVLAELGRERWLACFSQSGIDAYNALLSGWTDGGSERALGLNQALSEAFDADRSRMQRRPKLKRLKKMVLTQAESFSARFATYGTDADMAEEVSATLAALDSAVDVETGEVLGAPEALQRALAAARESGYAGMAVGSAAGIGYLSELVCGREAALHDADEACREAGLALYAKGRDSERKALSKGRGTGVLRSGVPVSAVVELADAAGIPCDWRGIEREAARQAARLAAARPRVEAAMGACDAESHLQTDELALDAARGMCGALLAMRRLAAMTVTVSGDGPLDRYECAGMPLGAFLAGLRRMCDRIRGHLTKKPYSKERWVLDFGNATLNAGWDAAKTKQYGNMIFQRGDRVYYAVRAPRDSEGRPVRFDMRLLEDAEGGEWRLLRVKNVPGAAKCLAKLFASASSCERYGMPEDLRDGMREHRYKDDPDFLRRLVEAVSARLTGEGVPPEWVPENWDRLGLKLEPADRYATWGEFCRDIDASRFAVWGARIPDAVVQENVSQGRIYLFEVYNRDMRARQRGTKRGERTNAYTRLLLEALSDTAAQHRVRILGGTEVFFRPASIAEPIVHRKGSWLVNRYYDGPDGERLRLPDDARTEIYNRLNGFSKAPLSPEAARYEKLAECHVADYDIVKDARFARDCFELHVGVEVNCGAPDGGDLRAAYDAESELAARFIGSDAPVLAIARGHRCLAYAVLMDRSGNVLEERSLDELDGIDWAARLRGLYEQRAGEQRSWRQRTSIKNLKETYVQRLAAWVGRKVAETGAVVAVESPDSGFSDRSSAFEPAVWKGFATALVTKLSCLVTDAALDGDEPGSPTNPLQLGQPWAFYAGKAGAKTGTVLHVPTNWVSDVDLSCGYAPAFSRAFAASTATGMDSAVGTLRSLRRKRSGYEAVAVPSDFAQLGFPAAAAAGSGPVTLTTAGLGAKVASDGEAMDVEAALTALLGGAGIDLSDDRDLRGDVCEKLNAAKKKELGRIMRTWLSADNGAGGVTASPVKGGEAPEPAERHKARAVGLKACLMIECADRQVVGGKGGDPDAPGARWHWHVGGVGSADWLAWLADRA